jgi:phosphoribosylaminoimidazolecarboxamide formyltransferase / IMP cyclohydrolase
MAVKRALISVYNKQGIVDFARGLAKIGVQIISTGGTFKALRENNVPVQEVAQVAGFPEILDGRVKTLQPQIHAGILAVRGNEQHMDQLREHQIEPIDMVVVNLYPFRETVADPNVSLEDAVEKIDIGGPSMVRSAAKNYQDVIVVVEPSRYAQVLEQLQRGGDLPLGLRFELMVEAFDHTAQYDAAISAWLTGRGSEIIKAIQAGQAPPPGTEALFPLSLSVNLSKVQDLRYGENPHQRAAFYRDNAAPDQGPTIAGSRQLHGKELSFNNINDAHAALELVKEFDEPAAVAVKHTNPCGVAVGKTLAEAYQKAYEADTVSIFGGVIALNRPCDEKTAAAISKIFIEIVLAPAFDAAALQILTKKKDIRLLEVGPILRRPPAGWDVKRVAGGFLVQEWDVPRESAAAWRAVSHQQPSPEQLADAWFAWRVCKHVKSNAIVVAKNGQTLGVGAGQMNRIDAARHALRQAGEKAAGAVLASDAFFPFPDVVEAAAGSRIGAIVQPGGSIRDQESIDRTNELGIAMLFTGIRHFRH